MSIVIIIPDITRSGGTERAGISLANSLCNVFDIHILSLIASENPPFYKINPSVMVSTANFESIPSNLFKKGLWYFKCYSYLKKFFLKYDIGVAIGLGHNINFLLSILKSKTMKVIGCEHIVFDTIPMISKSILKKFYSRLDSLVVLSNKAKENLNEYNGNILIIPNSIKSYGISLLNRKQIILVGRLSKEKGYERLVPLASRLKKDYPDWLINLYGDGPLDKELKLLFKENNLININMHSAISNIYEKYLESSLLVMTSHNEAMPMVILEAKSSGLPVVAYKNEGTNLLIHEGVDGFLVDNEEDFYNKVLYFVENEENRHVFGKNGYNSVQEYSEESVKMKWCNLLNNIYKN